DNMLFILMFSLYLLYIAYLCEKIDRLVARLSTHNLGITEHEGQCPEANTRLFRRVDTVSLVNRYRKSSVKELDQSMTIRLCEMQLYRRYFGLNLFATCRLDLKFVFGVTLFILNYVVLITQTQ